jgi:hypothetical protein
VQKLTLTTKFLVIGHLVCLGAGGMSAAYVMHPNSYLFRWGVTLAWAGLLVGLLFFGTTCLTLPLSLKIEFGFTPPSRLALLCVLYWS